MAREFSRTQRVGDYLQRELALLIQREMRDPRVGMVSITGVDVSRDLGHARVFFTLLEGDTEEEARATAEVLNGASGYLRSLLSREATMRSVPRLNFRFDSSVSRGRQLESLISAAARSDRELQRRAGNAQQPASAAPDLSDVDVGADVVDVRDGGDGADGVGAGSGHPQQFDAPIGGTEGKTGA